MALPDAALTILDGAKLRSLDLSLPEPHTVPLTGAVVIELAESTASTTSLFGLALPESVRLSALNRLNVDVEVFRCTEIEKDEAATAFESYVMAIADELEDDPLVAAILDGKAIQPFLENDDVFAMLANHLFTTLDAEHNGKLSKTEIQTGLVQMGIELGIPPFSEYPQLHDILKKHGADGEGDVGQAQFAQILQPVLQELAEKLAENNVVVLQNSKVATSSKIRMLLADEKQVNDLSEKILSENEEMGLNAIWFYLKKSVNEFGLPPLKPSEGKYDTGVFLFTRVFKDVRRDNNVYVSTNEEFKVLLVAILERFVDHIEACPIFYELDN